MPQTDSSPTPVENDQATHPQAESSAFKQASELVDLMTEDQAAPKDAPIRQPANSAPGQTQADRDAQQQRGWLHSLKTLWISRLLLRWLNPLKSPVFWILLIASVAGSYWRYTQLKETRQEIFQDSQVPKVENFSLGELGDKPFYQTDRDYELLRQFDKGSGTLELKWLLEHYNEYYARYFRFGGLDTTGIQVNQQQFPEIYQMVLDAAEILEVSPPRVYLVQDTGPTIRSTFHQNPIILISANFTWAFSPEQLRYLIAREVGHIKTNHVLYRDMLSVFQEYSDKAVPVKLLQWVRGEQQRLLIEWLLESEITADRAGLVVTGNPEVAAQALVKLKMGANVEFHYGPVNIKEYLQQLKSIQSFNQQGIGVLLAEIQSEHPFMPKRVASLLEFYRQNQQVFQ